MNFKIPGINSNGSVWKKMQFEVLTCRREDGAKQEEQQPSGDNSHFHHYHHCHTRMVGLEGYFLAWLWRSLCACLYVWVCVFKEKNKLITRLRKPIVIVVYVEFSIITMGTPHLYCAVESGFFILYFDELNVNNLNPTLGVGCVIYFYTLLILTLV